jgi:hypothetical protein
MNLDLNERIKVFCELGEILKYYTSKQRLNKYEKYYRKLDKSRVKAEEENPWFTQDNIENALKGIAHLLEKKQLEQWVNSYSELKKQANKPRKIGVVNAGNIPFVGFHDFLSVLMTNNIYYGKLSSKDKRLPKTISEILTDINPKFKKHIEFEDENLKKFDAIIATGSDNTSRYFEYYFSKYPHIIRKNRNSIAVLTGNESDEQLKKLADDIFLYFGLGCRNVSKIFFPKDYKFNRLFENFNHYEQQLKQHNKYANNYEYHRAIYLMNHIPHLDNGFVLLKEDSSLSSPIATIYYEMYNDINEVNNTLETQKDQIQCNVSDSPVINNSIPFGKSQKPNLWDFPDNIDTVEFILSLNE